MTQHFATAGDFKQALETRLRTEAIRRGVAVGDVRLRFVMDRLIGRLFVASNAAWLLKGGFAMDLRYRPHARTTRDIDLSVGDLETRSLSARLAVIRDELQTAAQIDPGDYLVFRIGAARQQRQGGPRGGGRFPVEALLASKTFARLHLDVGLGNPVIGVPDILVGEDFLGFAGLPPSRALAIPKAQQFAEKIHAYTHPWTDRVNTRVKDLVDLVLLIERGELDAAMVAAALEATFSTRGSHQQPKELAPPPEAWQREFPAMATQAALSTHELAAAFEILTAFWKSTRSIT